MRLWGWWPNGVWMQRAMDAIAEASGIGKAMYTNTGRNRDALLLELMVEANGLHARRELNFKLDTELSLLLGAIVYWHVFLRRKTEDPTQLAEAVVDAFWRAFAVMDDSPRVIRGLRAAR
jgi:AcrR family transcriptional regulator